MVKNLNQIMGKILYKDEVYAIQGAVFEVYRELGCGFLEAVYQEALEREFQNQQIPYDRAREIPIIYRGIPLKVKYKADFVCYGSVIVE